MALRFKNYIFYHIPKTGGTYTRKIISEIEKDCNEFGHNHNTPLEVDEHDNFISFTIVRHPLNWYKSYYRYRIESGWRKGHFMDQHAEKNSFEDFVKSFMKAYPCGFVTSRFLSVVPFVNHIIKTETLNQQLIPLLRSWGYAPSENHPRIKVTSRDIDTYLSEETKLRLLKAESRIIKYLKY